MFGRVIGTNWLVTRCRRKVGFARVSKCVAHPAGRERGYSLLSEARRLAVSGTEGIFSAHFKKKFDICVTNPHYFALTV